MKRLIVSGLLLLVPVMARADLRPPAGVTTSSPNTWSGTQTFSSGTFTTSLTAVSGTTSGSVATYGQLHVLQAPVTFATSSSSATTITANFALSNITATITPTSASSKILIIVNGEFSTTSTVVGAFGFFSVSRGATNIGDPSFGFGYVTNFISSAVTPDDYPIAFSTIDSPATTSATTYTVTMKSVASETVTFARASVPGTITLIEVQ